MRRVLRPRCFRTGSELFSRRTWAPRAGWETASCTRSTWTERGWSGSRSATGLMGSQCLVQMESSWCGFRIEMGRRSGRRTCLSRIGCRDEALPSFARLDSRGRLSLHNLWGAEMKWLQWGITAALLALVLGTRAAYLATRESSRPRAKTAASDAGEVPLVDERPLPTARALAALAITPEEQRLAQEAVRIAD